MPVQSRVGCQRDRRGLHAGLQKREDLPLDGLFLLVRKFVAGVAEDLDAVVPVRIVRGRDHHAGREHPVHRPDAHDDAGRSRVDGGSGHERAGAGEVGDAGSGGDSGESRARAVL